MSDWGVEVELTGESKEFIVSAELYVSPAAGAALRRPPNPRKKADKRESVRQLNGSMDDKKLKEKSSWLSGTKGPPGGGHWRSATCKLSEEGERCLFNIYVDESIMYQTLYIHLLNQTDIRLADTSLFFRKNCLAIHCVAGKRWAPTSNTTEPIYLQFNTTDACNTWLALLRSYALPEIYGRWFFAAEGGSYRMWRQVELTVIQGRNLGNSKPFESSFDDGADSASESDPVDMDIFCEVQLNDALCARTTTKKGIGSPDWHESYILSDLPPFDNLDLLVWREKRLFKPSLLGTVRIALGNFSRGESVEGWFPVLQAGSIASDLQVGEIRMKIRVDEEIILPYSSYGKLLKTFKSRNFLDWMTEFETKLKLKTIASQLMSISIANNSLIEQVQAMANREVDGSESSHQTLFRGNTILTKIMELCMSWYGKGFLEASIGKVLRRLCAEKVAIEVDPVRSGKGSKDVEKNVELLKFWCQEFWKQIYAVREECPPEMRRLFGTIRELVEQRLARSGAGLLDNRELRWQGVSAFCFLRFIVPAILHPHLFGLYPGLPPQPVQRSLTLIAKVIQSLANLNANMQKEEHMRGVKDFLTESIPAMIDYIVVVSSPVKDARLGKLDRADWHERSNMVNALKIRAASMPVLYRESIPLLPHTLDVPRHLAIVTSAVIRHSRVYFAEPRAHTDDKSLEEFCSRCFEVEEQALQRVSQLAAQLSANQQRHYQSQTPPSPPVTTSAFPPSPSSARSGRPSTAPDADSSRRLLFESTNAPPTNAAYNPPSSPVTSQPRSRLLRIKSTSTDSISSHVARDPSVGSVLISTSRTTESSMDVGDDPAKRKKGLLRIWRR